MSQRDYARDDWTTRIVLESIDMLQSWIVTRIKYYGEDASDRRDRQRLVQQSVALDACRASILRIAQEPRDHTEQPD